MAVNKKSVFSVSVDVLISLAFIAVCVLLFSTAIAVERRANLYWQAAFFFVVSAMFLSARYYSEQITLLKFIRWICETLSFPRGLYMTLIYSGLFGAVALIQLIRWMFWEPA